MEKLIEVHVRTNKNKFEFKEKDGKFIVSLKSKPKNNEANKELLNELSKKFKSVELVNGFKSSKKKLKIKE